LYSLYPIFERANIEEHCNPTTWFEMGVNGVKCRAEKWRI
jgi:hypothetical protein